MSRRKLVFVAHPLSGDVTGNLILAKTWLRWLINENPDCSFCLGWAPYCEVLDDDDPEHRERGIRDGMEMLSRCDELWMVGSRLSNGMADERDKAIALGLPVYSYVGLIDAPTKNISAVGARVA